MEQVINSEAKIDLFLEEIYPESKEAGEEMVASKLTTSQVRGLQTLVSATPRFSEIINYIKNQAGKGRWSEVGAILLRQLERIEDKAREISGDDPKALLEVKLKLARGWARQVVAHFLYEDMLRKKE